MALQFDYQSRKARFSSDPGRLDRRVTLLRPVRAADGAGGTTTSWQVIATVAASKLPLSGNRLFAGEQKIAEDLVDFRIRHRPDVVPYLRLVHGDDTYEITPPVRELGRRHFLEMTCRAINQTIGA